MPATLTLKNIWLTTITLAGQRQRIWPVDGHRLPGVGVAANQNDAERASCVHLFDPPTPCDLTTSSTARALAPGASVPA